MTSAADDVRHQQQANSVLNAGDDAGDDKNDSWVDDSGSILSAEANAYSLAAGVTTSADLRHHANTQAVIYLQTMQTVAKALLAPVGTQVTH